MAEAMMRWGVTPTAWLFLGLGVAVGWAWGQGRLGWNAVGAGLGEALVEPDTLVRFEALARVLRGVSASNQDEAFTGLEAHLVGIGEAEMDVVIHALTRVDPVSALERIETWPPRGDRVYAIREVFYSWARIDPSAASLAFDEYSKSTDAFEIQRKLVAGWARSGDVPGVTEYVSGLESPVPRQELVTEIAQARLKDGGPQAVIEWAQSVTPSASKDFRRDVIAKAARALALDDPKIAAEWVAGLARSEEVPVGAIRAVGVKWMQEDPAAALLWARGLPEHPERRMVVQQSMHTWLGRESDAAQAWIEKTPLVASDDPIISVYAQWLAQRSPTDGVAWSERIQDEPLRMHTISNVARIWHSQDATAAVAWLDQSGLPEETRRAVLEPPPQGRRGARRAIAPAPDSALKDVRPKP